ncbi:MAG: hypothetical protein C0625_11810 [Arcobacter sp.]|nr:MAG: hypothetical protein C0625_11810 [Arcobacter sp.]
MPKGKKTVIKEIKLLSDDEISINGKTYIILENTENIETAKTMKISSNGNRILRFDDEKKKARLDVKRDIDIVKYTILDDERAKKFSKGNDKSIITTNDKKDVVATASSFIKARTIASEFGDKESVNYDKEIGKSTFYLIEEM